ncbi:MAG: DUF362 domain-containing protein [Kiritimatiellia bacterium]|jgi:uncharacterized protein (DUF362 family)|nr:DUF362 domain-containing protein [Kiritimatiellia bacterium]
MQKLERRKFIGAALGSVAALNTPLLFAASKKAAGKSKVSAVRGDDLARMTLDSLEALGGMKTVVKEGETVFLKPNFVNAPWAKYNNCFATGQCTKPEIILAVTDECLKAGAREVIIGDGSQLPKYDWREIKTLDGKRDMVTEAKRLSAKYSGTVKLACLEVDSPGWVEVPCKCKQKKIAIADMVTKADRVITIPVAKTHSWAQLTLGTKNFVGVIRIKGYSQFMDNTWWNRGSIDHSSPRAISQIFLDITKAIKPDLSIVDFSMCLESNGPSIGQGGKTVDVRKRIGSWAVIASRDIMAADATAARIMSHDVKKMKQLTMGYEMGLGQIDEDSIEIVGEKLDRLAMKWKPAEIKGHM